MLSVSLPTMSRYDPDAWWCEYNEDYKAPHESFKHVVYVLLGLLSTKEVAKLACLIVTTCGNQGRPIPLELRYFVGSSVFSPVCKTSHRTHLWV